MPWRNGGGTTTEIAVHPAGADLDGFEWRVSLASMVADGPFSTLPGVERTLAVAEGRGIDLAVGTDRARRLDPTSDPFDFPGDAPAEARLVSGPVSILNVMTRRRWRSHRVTRLRLERVVDLRTSGSTVVYVTGAATVGELVLAGGDAVFLGGPPRRLQLSGRMTDAIVVTLLASR